MSPMALAKALMIVSQMEGDMDKDGGVVERDWIPMYRNQDKARDAGLIWIWRNEWSYGPVLVNYDEIDRNMNILGLMWSPARKMKVPK